MSITSALKKIKAAWTDSPLAGFIRGDDNAQKLDVVVSEIAEPVKVAIYDSGLNNTADVESYEGFNYVRVAITYQLNFSIHLSVNNASGTVGYMLIDLSDTTNWPHTLTNGHIVLQQVVVSVNPSTTPAFVGDLEFGFLENVDASNGDFHKIGTLHGERGAQIVGGAWDFSNYGFGLEVDEWFGPTDADDATWQTDVNLYGPDGNTSYPAGDGDLVVKLVSSAGTIDFDVTLHYITTES